MTNIDTLSQDQILSLTLFYADAGVNWLFKTPQEEATRSFTTEISHAKDITIIADPIPPSHSDINNPIIQQSYAIASCSNSLSDLKLKLSYFHDCPLQNTASSTICANQNDKTDLMIIGYTPSEIDNTTGEAFSGNIGQILDKMLTSIGIKKTHVCYTTISPWHPPGNRKLSDIEIKICRPLIIKQIELASPKIIFLLGDTTTQFFFNNRESYGEWKKININNKIISTLSTIHPQKLLEHPILKKIVWHHLISLKKALIN